MADWTEEEVWDYIRANDVPYHALYDQGYKSIGCAPCTRAVGAGDDLRAGRWWWEQDATHKETRKLMVPPFQVESACSVRVPLTDSVD